jgi:putative hemolysin
MRRSNVVRATRWCCVLVIGASLVSACGDDTEPSSTTVAIANPASVYCEEQGGEVEIVDEADGQRGYCLLPDGRRVDEWELFRSSTTAP